MFSIIIPLYNKAPYLTKALKSIFDQTFKDFEIIIVNDGSTDNSLEVLNSTVNQLKVNDNKLYNKIKIINQKNQGVSVARNNGFEISKYEYIAFLDADDWWEPTYLEEMKNLISEFSDAGIWASSYYVVKNNSRRLVRLGVEPEFEKGKINYFRVYAKTLEMPVWTGATVIKSSTYSSENGFKRTLSLGEDFDLWLRIAVKNPVVLLNKPLSNYNFDVEQKNRAVGKLYSPESCVVWNLDFLADEENKNPDLKQLFDNLRVSSMFDYLLSKNYRKIARLELEKVDWSKQPNKYFIKFKTPVFLLKSKYMINKLISSILNFIVRIIKNRKL